MNLSMTPNYYKKWKINNLSRRLSDVSSVFVRKRHLAHWIKKVMEKLPFNIIQCQISLNAGM